MTKEIVQGSLEPPLQVTLSDGGSPIADLDSAEEVRLRGVQYGIELFDDVVTPDAGGVCLRDWVDGDTDIPGRVWVEANIVWPGGREQRIQPVDVVDVLPQR